MPVIFIVTRAEGQYDEYHISNQAAFYQKSDAEDYITKRKAEIAINEAIEDELGDIYHTYDAEYPCPHISRHDIPRWAAGLSDAQITQAMRDERDKLQALNREIAEENSRQHGKWMDKLLLAQQEHVKSKGYDFKIESVCYGSRKTNYTWDIEELDIA